MSDLIRREDAMMEARPEYLNPNQKGHEEYNKAWNDGIKAYWNGLKELPSELEWIPCSERLPEPLQEVIVTSVNGHVYTSRIVHGEFEYGGDVIAWMPLPPAYKEETDE